MDKDYDSIKDEFKQFSIDEWNAIVHKMIDEYTTIMKTSLTPDQLQKYSDWMNGFIRWSSW